MEKVMQGGQKAEVLDLDAVREIIERKRSRIQELLTALDSERKELSLAESLFHMINNPEMEFSWSGFLEFIKEDREDLHEVLKYAVVSTFDLGRLRLKVPAHAAALLRLNSETIIKKLKEFSGVIWNVQILTVQ
jgi:hypothetical protein